MCGIAGIIHRGKSSNVGSEMTAMLTALKHRGPDSSGFAVYGIPKADDYLMRIKVAEQEDMGKGHGIMELIEQRISRLKIFYQTMERRSKNAITLLHMPCAWS